MVGFQQMKRFTRPTKGLVALRFSGGKIGDVTIFNGYIQQVTYVFPVGVQRNISNMSISTLDDP